MNRTTRPIQWKGKTFTNLTAALKSNGILCGCPSDAICLKSRPASRSGLIAPRIDDVITQRRVTARCAADSFRSSIDTRHRSRTSCRARELPVVDRGKTQTRWSGISTESSHREWTAAAWIIAPGVESCCRPRNTASRNSAPLILSLGTRCLWVVTFTLRPIDPWDRTPGNRRRRGLVERPVWVWHRKEKSPL